MAPNELHRGRLIDHLQIVTPNLAAMRRFYGALFETLGVPIEEGPDFFYCDELFISSKESKAAAGALTGRVHLAFQAASREVVDRAYAAGLTAGGKDNGKPAERAHYHPGYYAGFLLDPDGNNIEAVFHGPGKRSADSVVIRT
jgi:catechol 2,3-dioxygenase-like lactoylglutathione lyase family enzyme